MTATNSLTTEQFKEGLLALFKSGDAEFKQAFAQFLIENFPASPPKRTKKKHDSEVFEVNQSIEQRIPYEEMPYWKLHPNIKTRTAEELGGKPVSKESFEALIAWANNPELRLTDEMIEGIDDI